ncbi:hypothetical protein OUZ56_012416 [Daphnia magna]|uniref:Uncharacterized protein n=1 Tax=Daphnia magna TaxID=35525 RepID=A0ABQ9Z470_9CRUS|nr:hypothetical protein OUZ56_012416 [Daphnia magna]
MSTEYWHSELVIAVATLISINIKQICYPAKYSVTDDDNFRFSSAICIDTTQQQQLHCWHSGIIQGYRCRELVIAVATLMSISPTLLLGHTATRCRQRKRCRNCTKPHTQDATNTCITAKCCRNCNSDRHTSDDKSCPVYRHKQQILNFAQAENLSFHKAKEVLASKRKNHEQTPEPITTRSTNQFPSNHCASPTGISPPDPIKSKIESLRHEVSKLQCEVKSLKNQLVSYTPLDLSNKMQENISSTAKLHKNLKTSLDPIVPAMVRLTPNIPYIEENCRLVRQQQETTTT